MKEAFSLYSDSAAAAYAFNVDMVFSLVIEKEITYLIVTK